MIEYDRETFELYSIENMKDESNAIIAATQNLADPTDVVAEILTRVANVGYLAALEDMRKGILALAKKMHNGHPALTGVLLAEEKITLVYRELYSFMWPDADTLGHINRTFPTWYMRYRK